MVSRAQFDGISGVSDNQTLSTLRIALTDRMWSVTKKYGFASSRVSRLRDRSWGSTTLEIGICSLSGLIGRFYTDFRSHCTPYRILCESRDCSFIARFQDLKCYFLHFVISKSAAKKNFLPPKSLWFRGFRL